MLSATMKNMTYSTLAPLIISCLYVVLKEEKGAKTICKRIQGMILSLSLSCLLNKCQSSLLVLIRVVSESTYGP